jgi:hypothetical protein
MALSLLAEFLSLCYLSYLLSIVSSEMLSQVLLGERSLKRWSIVPLALSSSHIMWFLYDLARDLSHTFVVHRYKQIQPCHHCPS